MNSIFGVPVESYFFVGANIHGLSKFCWFVEEVVSWVTGLLHPNVGQFITLLHVPWDVNWAKIIHEH